MKIKSNKKKKNDLDQKSTQIKRDTDEAESQFKKLTLQNQALVGLIMEQE